MLQEAGSDIHQ